MPTGPLRLYWDVKRRFRDSGKLIRKSLMIIEKLGVRKTFKVRYFIFQDIFLPRLLWKRPPPVERDGTAT